MSALGIAIHDAANNCKRSGATATLTLRSGKEITGKLETPGVVDGDRTVHVRTGTGWATALTEEVVAVESWR